MTENNGGPAFPKLVNGYTEDGTGMTLRDWFAGMALTSGMCGGIADRPEFTAGRAYTLADAMLLARGEA